MCVCVAPGQNEAFGRLVQTKKKPLKTKADSAMERPVW